MKNMVRLGALSATILTAACGGARSQEPGEADQSPEAAFSALEERLVSAETLELDFRVTAEGAVEADLEGGLRIEEGGITEVSAKGLFAGQEVDLLLSSEGDRYEFGNGPDRISDATPRFLNEALLIGLTRMGILHNLAMLVGNAPPDGSQGGVRDWVTVEGFSFDEASDALEGSWVVSFTLIVGGIPAGTAALEIGSEGIPVVRRQTVQFPGGEMRVVERYTRVEVRR